MVEDMLDLVRTESERIDSRFLEPACGSGNFLRAVLTRKLRAVGARYKQSEFELGHYALLALMSIYGIELLDDNVDECRENLLGIFTTSLGASKHFVWQRAASNVLAVNIVQGDALTLKNKMGEYIVFPEWGYLGGGKYQRRDFRFEGLTQRSQFQPSDQLFSDDQLSFLSQTHEVFAPARTYPPMTVEEIAK